MAVAGRDQDLPHPLGRSGNGVVDEVETFRREVPDIDEVTAVFLRLEFDVVVEGNGGIKILAAFFAGGIEDIAVEAGRAE